MRTTLRKRIIDAVSEVQVLEAPGGAIDYEESKVWEPHMAGPDEEPPFIVLAQLQDDQLRDSSLAGTTTFEITPLVGRTSFKKLDTIVDKLEAAFDWVVFTHGVGAAERPYVSEVQPSERDSYFTDWGMLALPLTVSVFDLNAFVSETFDPDPVKGFRLWAEAKWPELAGEPQIQTDPLTWRPSNEAPGVLARLMGLPAALEQWPTVSWMQAQLRVHVIAPSRTVRLQWTKRIAEALASDRRFMMPDRHRDTPFTLEGTLSANSEAHAVSTGQITVQGRYGVLHVAEDVEKLQTINLTGDAAP